MYNVLPNTIKYRLQTWSEEHWKTHYKDKASEKVSKVIDFLRQVPDASYLFKRAKSVISALSPIASLPIPTKEKKPIENLHDACEQGDIKEVKVLIAAGFNVNEYKNDLSPLHKAVYENQIEIVSLLLDKGAVIDQQTKGNFRSPLEIACARGNLDIVKLLLKRGANPNRYFQESPLHHACKCSDLEMVELLLKFKADINAKNNCGISPLLQAVMGEKIELVQLLLESGSNVNAQNKVTLKSSLHEATERGNTKILILLLGKNVDVNIRDKNGNTPLHFARNKEIARLLLEKRADIDALNNEGKTLLTITCDVWSPNEELGRFLVEQGANIHIKCGDKPLLYYALVLNLYQLARTLIAKDANLLQESLNSFRPDDILNSDELIAVLKECKYDFSPLIKDENLLFRDVFSTNALKNLISMGVNVNVQNEKGDTPLHTQKHLSIVEALIKGGADPYIKNKKGETPFDTALQAHLDKENKKRESSSEDGALLRLFLAIGNELDILYLYLKRDLSLFDPTKFSKDALEELMQKACRDNYEELALKLLNLGVKVDTQDKHKFTALDHALTQGHFNLLKKIIEKLGGSYKAFIEHKFLAHVFGLKGFSDFNTLKVDHEGFNYRLSAEMLALLGGEFLKDRKEHKELFDLLQEAPANLNLSPEELMKKMDEKPVILFTGWDRHIVALIFYKGIVLKCNRGSMSPSEGGGIEIFRMQNKEKLPAVLDDLQKQATSQEGRSLLYNRMNKDLNLENEGVFILKNQPVGNCGWSSAKAAFLGAAYLLNLKQGLSDGKARVEGMRLFKEFNTFVRGRVVDYCVTNTENLDKF